jgi:CheY-like chemotaxis protein/HPt (histidine-containing phosphotransfer) domain-containing protein
MTELLLETRLDEEQKEYATQVKYAAEVLIGLINDILDFSKIEAGKLPLEIIQCDLISLVEEAVEMVSLLAHKKGLEIIIDIAKDVPSWVLGDPVRIRQILINLINNAVKFTQQGEILIRVRVISVEGEIYRIRFEVIDTGIGIPEDKQSILFAPFTQVDFSTTRKFGGTGLGLSISKSLVEMMNGTIGVTSKLGAGSNFHFMIPLERVLDHEEEVEIIVDEVHAKRPVLVVENNEHVWQVLYYHLTDWFERVDWARTGQAALERLKRSSEKPYGLVLVDQRLPEMDGWQFASEVRNTSLTVSPSLILMSPLGFGTEAKMKLLGWFSGYLDKPITRKKLLECIGSVLYGTETIQESDKIHLEKVEEASWIGKRILVAEDHLVNQQLFKTILEKFGLTVILAENGLAAVEGIEKNPVDLVFMDVQMPIMNGYEASILIRQRGYRVPIVAVTANAVKGEREKCIETGMDDYLTKPFKSKDLIPYLQKYLRSGRAGEEDVPGMDEIEEAELLTTDLEEISASLVQPDTEVFNYPAAVETFLGKADVVMRVVQAFREKVLDQLHEMQVALDNENWDTLTVISHGIKGGAWNLEAKRLGDAAARLEQASKNKERQRAMESLRDIEREFRAFERFLDQQLKLPAKE